MKTCSKCLTPKDLGQFNRRVASPDGYQPLCRTCQNARDISRYREKPQKTVTQVRRRTVKNNAVLGAIKTASGCADCGLVDSRSWLFDFDHLGNKTEDVSRMLGAALERLLAEAKKCEPVCSNCHRIRTYVRKHGTLSPVPPVKARRVPVLMRMWERLLDFKSKPCLDCGKSLHFSAMDCDHRDPSTKLGEPSNLARNGPESVFEAELAKCDVVCSNCHRVRTHGGSQSHREMENYAASLGGRVAVRCLPLTTQVGHYKTVPALRQSGVDFLGVYEDEWRSKQDLVRAMVRHRSGVLGTTRRASKLTLVKLTKNSQFDWFFARNHLDGHARARYAFGLFEGDKLLCCASIRTNHQGECELARLATDYDYHVYGGAGRLIKAILKEEGKLVTFSNNRLSHGKTYQILGFSLVQENPPSYWYTDGNERIWRYRCRRVNDPEILRQFPEVEHTEKAQAAAGILSLGIWGDRRPLFRIEDYGHRKWVLDVQPSA